MNEGKRVCGNRRFLILILALLVVNAAFTVGALRDHAGKTASWSEATAWEWLSAYREVTADYAGKTAAQAEEEFSNLQEQMLAGGVYSLRMNVLQNRTIPQLRAAEGFYDGLLAIQEQAERLSQISLFSKPGTFSYRNIIRTAVDFAPLRSVTPRLVNEIPALELSESAVPFLLAFLACVWLLTQVIEEPGDPLRKLLYQTRRGRHRLSARRLGLLAGIAAGVFCLLTAESALILRLLAGQTDLSAPVQSITALQNVTLLVSVGEYLLLTAAIRLAGLLVLLLVFWLIQAAFRRESAGALAAGLLLGLEYVLYRYIPQTSGLVFLKAVNLWAPGFVHDWLETYRNLNVFGFPANAFAVTAIAAVCLLPLLSAGVILLDVRARGRLRNRTESRLLQGLRRLRERLVLSLKGVWWEFYRIYILDRRLLILVLLFIVCWHLFPQTYSPSPYASDYVEFNLRQYSGPFDSEEVRQGMAREQAAIDAEMDKYAGLCARYEAGEISREEMEIADRLMESWYRRQTVMQQLSERQWESEAFRERTGKALWFVQEDLFRKLIGDRREALQRVPVLTAVLAMILVFGHAASSERQSGMGAVADATRGGMPALRRRRQGVMLFAALVCWVTAYGLSFLSLWRMYPFSWWEAPVQSLTDWKTVRPVISCGAYLGGVYLLRLAILIVIGEIILAISARSRTNRQALLTELILLLPLTVLTLVV